MDRPTLGNVKDANRLFFSGETKRFFGDTGEPTIHKNKTTGGWELNVRSSVPSFAVPGKQYKRTSIYTIEPETLQLRHDRVENESRE